MENERTSADLERANAPDGAAMKENGSSVQSKAAAPALTTLDSAADSSPSPAAKASEDAHHSLERNEKGVNGAGQTSALSEPDAGRERANSSDSFVTSREVTSPVEVDGDRQVGDALSAAGTKATSNGSMDKVETGFAGLVIKEDGSIGAA